MLQEVFRIGNIPIYGYGVMMVIGFLTAVQVAKFLAKRSRIDPEIFVNAALIALIAGVAGARISHVLENLPEYTRTDRSFAANFFAMINVRSGGLTFYGGLILAFPIVLYYGWIKKVNLRLGMDIVAPCVTLGLAFGRIGCLLNGCCYGAECNLPWAVRFPYQSIPYSDQVYRHEIAPPKELLVADLDGERLVTQSEIKAGKTERRVELADGKVVRETMPLDEKVRAEARAERSLPLHPAQVYSALNSFLITAILIAFFTMRPSHGRVMALMLMLEGPTRFLLEMVRAEPPVVGPMSLSMVIGLGLAVIGIIMWFAFGPRGSGVRPERRIAQPQPRPA
ncbi:MAG TPA: prolipoprotein diacylglyceryl transferase [Tepidisphaeraceae bacterium]|jgi:phosphatidylglycerol:prolipoprotein diacylglycerol transferase